MTDDTMTDGGAPRVPDGWVLVPAEPTAEMLRAADWVRCSNDATVNSASTWRTMLAAAPKPPTATPKPERMFPIMGGPAIPWSAIAPYERQAQENHGQSLKRLAERGGLSVCEAIAVLECKRWDKTIPRDPEAFLKIVARRKAIMAASPDLIAAARKALNYIENTEAELGIKLDSGEALRAAIEQDPAHDR